MVDRVIGAWRGNRREGIYGEDLPPYTYFLLNGDMELNRNR